MGLARATLIIVFVLGSLLQRKRLSKSELITSC